MFIYNKIKILWVSKYIQKKLFNAMARVGYQFNF